MAPGGVRLSQGPGPRLHSPSPCLALLSGHALQGNPGDTERQEASCWTQPVGRVRAYLGAVATRAWEKVGASPVHLWVQRPRGRPESED